MSQHMRWFVLALACFLLLSLLTNPRQADAQQGQQIWLAPPETGSFPQISTYLDVRDAQGNFVYGLDRNNVSVLEDDRRIPVKQLNRLRAGVQLVTAINPGPSFAIRDLQGNSRYDYIVQSLQAWGQSRQGSTLDDISFLASGGPEATHLSDISDWLSALSAYETDLRSTTPNYDVLARALDVAADPPIRPGMGQAVLFVTALPDQEAGMALQSLASRATQHGVRLYIWLVASPEWFTSQDARQLEEIAAKTGGAFFGFSGPEIIPDLEEFLEPLRNTYFLTYNSSVTNSGLHRLAVEVKTGGWEVISFEQEFELEISPPNVAFISPRLRIVRTTPVDGGIDFKELEPEAEPLEILIEFPDGHTRPIQRSTLYVDGEIADENTVPDFDRFTWDLSMYSTPGQHTLTVEVVDSLGLKAVSMETMVSIIIERPQPSVLVTLSRNRPLVARLAGAFAAAVLLLVLILGGRIRPGFLGRSRRKRRRADPVTQPVPMKSKSPPQRLPGWIKRFQLPQRLLVPKAHAYLARISEYGQEETSPPIPITNDDVIFGRDPIQATQVLDDPSVEALHARLIRKEDGTFRLVDQGSVAGTWINYTPISQEGARLEHGDIVHLGRVGFRFMMREPDRIRKPVIIPKEPQS